MWWVSSARVDLCLLPSPLPARPQPAAGVVGLEFPGFRRTVSDVCLGTNFVCFTPIGGRSRDPCPTFAGGTGGQGAFIFIR